MKLLPLGNKRVLPMPNPYRIGNRADDDGILFSDTFTDADSTALPDHTDNIDVNTVGAVWVADVALEISNNECINAGLFDTREAYIDSSTAVRFVSCDHRRIGAQIDRFMRITLGEDSSQDTYGQLKGDELLTLVVDNVIVASKPYAGSDYIGGIVFGFHLAYDDVANEITVTVSEGGIETDSLTTSHTMIPRYAGFTYRGDPGAVVDNFQTGI